MPFMDALDDSSDEDNSEIEEEAEKAIKNGLMKTIKYEHLLAHGFTSGPTVLEVPDPEAKQRAEAQAKAEAEEATGNADQPIPLIKNAFGKWQFEGSDPKRRKMGPEADPPPPQRTGPTALEVRSGLLRDQAEVVVGAQDKFDLTAVSGAAAGEKKLEQVARAKLHAKEQKKTETTRQKNKRKQALGQAHFDLKTDRDCPDIFHK
mmetsp:Transcript_9694/g.13164  ORF Transcript_9694/g.13164 Transcript_9694/m.13164 type:complete len:205 (+) Transcript_9694:128-742(+)|eukprot:CAMPEP_0196575150 /NCGR_PEP_ID=MMETSP1081-20130531/4687_1 /TAXON_ID=36882 /ORGANISM="Pyramimonas amylifera, Strain CCMP720" /LENGTH=204 /DNA_ID=CAMNT_0041893353 /DNA_START=110 /DNA_END=727 /DNA_ORIENTATION=-